MYGLMGCGETKEEKNETAKYAVTTPLVIDTSITRDYVAQIQSIQNIEIRAKVDGYLDEIHVDEGQFVQQGQLLFKIRPREYEAELAKAKAAVRKAELDVQNVKTLADKNIVSQNELAMAMAKLDEAKAEQSRAELYLSYTTIKAPFSGTIDRLKFKIGSLIDEGTLLTTLSNNKEVYAYFNVSEIEYLDYRSRPKNDERNVATLLLANSQPHKYKGLIETVEGEFDNNTGTIAFRAKFPNPDLLLKHGETGKVLLTTELKDAIVIPQKATFEIQDKTFVYVIDANNVAKSRCITIKQKLPNIYIIDSGLASGEKFLLEGVQSVNDDDTIQTVIIAPDQALVPIEKQ